MSRSERYTPPTPEQRRSLTEKGPPQDAAPLKGAWHLHAETVFQIRFTTPGIPDSLTVAARL
ncbi:MAG: hypothetical protein ACKOEO_01255 [Planctomycetaceae bacterium]